MKIVSKYQVKPDEKMTPDSLIKILLENRGVKKTDEFLNPTHPSSISISDFGFKKEIKKTLSLLQEIKKNNRMIVVYSDYDADGITGGAILWETLHLLGFKVMPYVPHRKLEGYGFSIKGIDNVKKQFDPALIISVDHGISAREKIAYAKKLSIDVIVTDHHLKPEKLPDKAFSIFHIPALSGSGVSYFFSKMVFEYFEAGHPKGVYARNLQLLASNFASDYLALASIGTIADLVPLIGPSRSVVKYGLAAFAGTKRIGIKHIMKEAGIDGKPVTPYTIGFVIAPRINAVGRLEHAIDALRLLCTKREDKAEELAGKVSNTNKERQDLVEKSVKEAVEKFEKILRANHSDLRTPAVKKPSGGFANTSVSSQKLPNIIILHSKDWHEGIIGLIASKLCEKYYRPAIVLTDSDGFLKGSARSIPGFHITDFLRELKKYLIDVGGHPGASGFTMEKAKFDQFVEKAEKKAEKEIGEKDLERTITVDLKIPLAKINRSIVESFAKLEPFGIGNPAPVFLSDVEILDAKLFGKKNEHLKIIVKDPQKQSFPIEFIAFGSSELYAKLSRNMKTQIVYSLEINRWNGQETIRGRIIQIILNNSQVPAKNNLPR